MELLLNEYYTDSHANEVSSSLLELEKCSVSSVKLGPTVTSGLRGHLYKISSTQGVEGVRGV